MEWRWELARLISSGDDSRKYLGKPDNTCTEVNLHGVCLRPEADVPKRPHPAKSGQSHWDWAGALKARPASVLECLAMYSFAE